MTNYWLNPNKKKYFDSSVAIPLFNKENLFQIKDRVAVENAIDALEKAEIDLKTLIQLRIGQLVNNVRRKLKKDDSDCERLKKSRFSNLTLSLFSKKANAQPRPEVAESDDGAGRRDEWNDRDRPEPGAAVRRTGSKILSKLNSQANGHTLEQARKREEELRMRLMKSNSPVMPNGKATNGNGNVILENGDSANIVQEWFRISEMIAASLLFK